MVFILFHGKVFPIDLFSFVLIVSGYLVEQSHFIVINIKLLGGGGVNRFYRRLTSPSSSAVAHNI